MFLRINISLLLLLIVQQAYTSQNKENRKFQTTPIIEAPFHPNTNLDRQSIHCARLDLMTPQQYLNLLSEMKQRENQRNSEKVQLHALEINLQKEMYARRAEERKTYKERLQSTALIQPTALSFD